ncbi:NAD(P)-dependent oxidoreductase [Rhodovulum sp. 12E13]|uniref:NAD-dependent epimerase/dehydratase family protein n=1 Tax=Rhodovulum sp. 12E13 TaxID=2203891 RepID=UPI000E1723D3|nr:NAD(P)-dependent oxidoreductase [Rhodovulum sp. 12E13]RDC73829.1 NAD(P)-dependent oxidoreductase [Rhodovulum sp. 12E13]
MRVGVTGASGTVGHWIAAGLLAAGHGVVALGRRPSRRAEAESRPFELGGPPPDLAGLDALVHAAFSHVPGRYRGGEGDDPEGFARLNRDGTVRLFEAARAAGVGRVVFLSSRAVLTGWPPGTTLHEGLEPRPDTLYGEVKVAAERALAALSGPGFVGVSLRATGVYGPPAPGLPHKWQPVLDAFARGVATAPRAGTEVHAGDLAASVRLLVEADPGALSPGVFHCSDILLDRRDLLAEWSALTGAAGPLPERADAGQVSVMRTDGLRALGWQPRGWQGVTEVLRALACTG